MVSLDNGSSRVCLGALDRVAVAEGVEDLEDEVLSHFENLLHLDALQGNDPSWSLLIPVDRNQKKITSDKPQNSQNIGRHYQEAKMYGLLRKM